jgi:hypothetical protein
MNSLFLKWKFRFSRPIIIFIFIQTFFLIGMQPHSIQGNSFKEIPIQRVNIPYIQDLPFEPAIFWFGQIDPFNNYTDVRLWYYEEYLIIVCHIIDRLHWQDPSGVISDLTNWDAVSLYFDLDGNVGNAPGVNTYRLDAQLGGLKASYRGNESGWSSYPFPFDAVTTWRGARGPNSGVDGKGWQVDFMIPFSSFGLSSKPPSGTTWGLGVIMHDRDDATGSNITHTIWPETMTPDTPNSWAHLSFGQASYNPPTSIPTGEVFIRHGKDGAVVVDAAVGGHTICGEHVDHWTGWGEANYAGYSQFNIQNQWDISDWPCFSKYYITFPLDSVPLGKIILSAKLALTLFGNAGGGHWGEPPDSYIKVFSVGEDWDEETLTWNSAPLALENISGTWVYPRDYSQPDQLYYWDVGKAVNSAYQSGQPLGLAVYSIDGEMHSGKYFWTSNADEWARPTLQIQYGQLCDDDKVKCHFTYLPLTLR